MNACGEEYEKEVGDAVVVGFRPEADMLSYNGSRIG
jgi:hypothetical protein